MVGRLTCRNLLDLANSPRCLHPFTLVVAAVERVKGIDLNDLLTQRLGVIDHLLLLGSRLSFSLHTDRFCVSICTFVPASASVFALLY